MKKLGTTECPPRRKDGKMIKISTNTTIKASVLFITIDYVAVID